jgi:hypothetical protein
MFIGCGEENGGGLKGKPSPSPAPFQIAIKFHSNFPSIPLPIFKTNNNTARLYEYQSRFDC